MEDGMTVFAVAMRPPGSAFGRLVFALFQTGEWPSQKPAANFTNGGIAGQRNRATGRAA